MPPLRIGWRLWRRAARGPKRLLGSANVAAIFSRQRLIAEGFVLALLLIWWLGAPKGSAFLFPGPADTFKALIDLFAGPSFFVHVLSSAARVLLSVALAMALGLGLALAARRFPIVEGIVYARIQPVLLSFPSLGWVLLGVVWFRAGDATVVFIQVMILLPFALAQFREGVATLDADMLEMGASFGRRQGRLIARVAVPLLAPYAVAAGRICYGVAWKVAVVAELFATDRGVAYLMHQAQLNSDTASVLAAVFAIIIVFLVGEKLVIDPLARRWVRGRLAPQT